MVSSINNVNPAYVTFSKHSLERMAERKIEPAQVRKCVSQGLPQPANDGCKAFVCAIDGYTKKALKVVLNQANNIVTACWERMPKELKNLGK